MAGAGVFGPMDGDTAFSRDEVVAAVLFCDMCGRHNDAIHLSTHCNTGAVDATCKLYYGLRTLIRCGV